nr:immunoglobulin light chain junction region [Macaca mulatta]MOY00865.1 immunoglobulin light chain junction region [Macaca mulatta]MOY01950.1 immunoglobulin light chain junction region [Macaca mulatta]
CMQDVELPLTF